MKFESEFNSIANLEEISLNENALLRDGQKADSVFCKSWPSAKAALEAILVIIKSPFVKIAVGLVIQVGEGIFKKNCA